jgi:hypothetical protein
LRPSAEKNGGLTAVLLCEHERSVTSTITKEQSDAMDTKRASGNSASILHIMLKSMQKVAPSNHNVESGDREPRDNECISNSKVTRGQCGGRRTSWTCLGHTRRPRPGHPPIVWPIVHSPTTS